MILSLIILIIVLKLKKSKLAKTVIAELKKDISLYENVTKSLIEIINPKNNFRHIFLTLKSKIGCCFLKNIRLKYRVNHRQ